MLARPRDRPHQRIRFRCCAIAWALHRAVHHEPAHARRGRDAPALGRLRPALLDARAGLGQPAPGQAVRALRAPAARGVPRHRRPPAPRARRRGALGGLLEQPDLLADQLHRPLPHRLLLLLVPVPMHRALLRAHVAARRQRLRWRRGVRMASAAVAAAGAGDPPPRRHRVPPLGLRRVAAAVGGLQAGRAAVGERAGARGQGRHARGGLRARRQQRHRLLLPGRRGHPHALRRSAQAAPPEGRLEALQCRDECAAAPHALAPPHTPSRTPAAPQPHPPLTSALPCRRPDPHECNCDQCSPSESIGHLAPVGILFTLVFTYLGFLLLALALAWRAPHLATRARSSRPGPRPLPLTHTTRTHTAQPEERGRAGPGAPAILPPCTPCHPLSPEARFASLHLAAPACWWLVCRCLPVPPPCSAGTPTSRRSCEACGPSGGHCAAVSRWPTGYKVGWG